MIASSNRGGGGSGRKVVFRVVVEGGDANKVLDALTKKADALNNRLKGMSVGVAGAPGRGGVGGAGGAGGGGGGGGGGGSGGRGGIASSGRGGALSFSDDANERKQRAFFDRALREETRAIKQAAGERRKMLGEMKRDANDALEGVVSLSRAFVLLGVSGEENMEKAVRALAKFEAGVQGVRGAMKLSGALGGGLTRLAPALGMKAGAGGAALGAAGLAAGVGVLGAGAAIYDQINYSRTGQIGAYSQNYANIGTSLARYGIGLGIDPRQGGWRGALANQIPGNNLLGAAGFYGAAQSGLNVESGLAAAYGQTSGALQYNQQQMGPARQRLAQMDQTHALARTGLARKDAVIESYASMDPFQRQQMNRLRNQYLADPGSLNGQQLVAIRGTLGETENADITRRLRKNYGGQFDKGFAAEDKALSVSDRLFGTGGIKVDETKLQRELVLKLETDNDALVQRLEEIASQALDTGNEDLTKKVQEMEKRLNQRLKEIQQQQQNANNSIANAYGVAG